MHHRHHRLWPLALGTFAIGFGSNVITGLLPSMSADLGVTLADS
jgi:predicted MFS family arabinose efflux permease